MGEGKDWGWLGASRQTRGMKGYALKNGFLKPRGIFTPVFNRLEYFPRHGGRCPKAVLGRGSVSRGSLLKAHCEMLPGFPVNEAPFIFPL